MYIDEEKDSDKTELKIRKDAAYLHGEEEEKKSMKYD